MSKCWNPKDPGSAKRLGTCRSEPRESEALSRASGHDRHRHIGVHLLSPFRGSHSLRYNFHWLIFALFLWLVDVSPAPRCRVQTAHVVGSTDCSPWPRLPSLFSEDRFTIMNYLMSIQAMRALRRALLVQLIAFALVGALGELGAPTDSFSFAVLSGPLPPFFDFFLLIYAYTLMCSLICRVSSRSVFGSRPPLMQRRCRSSHWPWRGPDGIVATGDRDHQRSH